MAPEGNAPSCCPGGEGHSPDGHQGTGVSACRNFFFFFLLSVPEGGNYEPFQLGTIRLQATALLWLGVRDARIRLGQPLSDIFESAKAIIRCRRQGIVDDSKRLIPPVVCSVLGIIIDKRDQFEI